MKFGEDSLGVEIYSREVAKQKLDYIHFNPVNGKWKLAKDDLDYQFSSAKFPLPSNVSQRGRCV